MAIASTIAVAAHDFAADFIAALPKTLQLLALDEGEHRIHVHQDTVTARDLRREIDGDANSTTFLRRSSPSRRRLRFAGRSVLVHTGARHSSEPAMAAGRTNRQGR